MDIAEKIVAELTGNENTDPISESGSLEVSQEPQAIEPAEQPVSETDLKQEEWDHTKDARWNKMWKKPEDIYKSYRNLESEFELKKPITVEYENIKKTFEENGLPLDKLNDYITEYKELSNPNNPKNMIGEYFSNYIYNKPDSVPLMDKFFEFVDKPEYAPHLKNFFSELEKTDNQKKYPGWNDEQIAEHRKMQSEINEFKELFNTQKEEQRNIEINKEIEASFSRVEKYAKNKDFEFSNGMKEEIAKYCLDKGYSSSQIYPAFLELYGDKIQDAYLEKQLLKKEESTLKNLNKANKEVVPNASISNSSALYAKDASFTDKFKSLLNNN